MLWYGPFQVKMSSVIFVEFIDQLIDYLINCASLKVDKECPDQTSIVGLIKTFTVHFKAGTINRIID